MIKIPTVLEPYVDFDEGEIIARNLPNELVPDFEQLKQLYEKTKNDELTDY